MKATVIIYYSEIDPFYKRQVWRHVTDMLTAETAKKLNVFLTTYSTDDFLKLEVFYEPTNKEAMDLLIQSFSRIKYLIRSQNNIKISITKELKETINIDEIEKTVCTYFNIHPILLKSDTHKREIVQSRQIVMYFSRNMTRKSLSDIGNRLGGRDHTTVIHACKTVNNLIDTDKKYRVQIEEIKQKLLKAI